MRKQLTVDDILNLNLNHLRYFYEVARAGNMRRAALRLGVSQPALSKQIQALEDALGLPLFFRTARGLQPTADGDVALSHSERIFAHVRDLEAQLDARRRGSAGRLAVGAIPSVAGHILPPFIGRYREACPMVRLRILTARARSVVRALEEHRVDVGLIAEAPSSDRLVVRPFQRASLVVVAAPGSPLAREAERGPLPVAALHRADMVAFDPPAPTRRIVDRHLSSLGVSPRIMVECPDVGTMRELVARRLGFCIVPQDTVESDVQARRLQVLPVNGWELTRTLSVAHQPLDELSPVVRSFVELFPRLDR
jgi:DNA-binding transcriptional LysR family regulator